MDARYRLAQEIIARSNADTWDRAKLEWDLESVYLEEEPDTCLCGHFPIIEICVLRNRENGNSADVGNVCVKKFLGLPSDSIFQAVKRVRKDSDKSFNEEAVNYAYRKGWINQWELEFYLDIMRKRSLSAKQRGKKLEVNQKLLSRIVNARNVTS